MAGNGAKLAKVTKRDVKKAIVEQGKWSGWMVGNKVVTWHVNNGWCIGCWVEFESLEQMEHVESSYLHYLDRELGTYCHWYVEV